MNFSLIGAAGFIAPRHMRAIRETGHELLAAVDPHDCVGHLDSFFPDARFFTEIERFDRFLEKRRRGSEDNRVHFVSICTPNYLHDAHVRLALRVRANAICEKPLVICPWNLDALQELEHEYGSRVFTVLQLRLVEPLRRLKRELEAHHSGKCADICLSYITRRGKWYDVSWKGSADKSGGISMNIGVHFFDLLVWLFGQPERYEVHLRTNRKMSGVLFLERACVRWFLSVDEEDLPKATREAGKYAYRSMTIDGQEIEFSDGFTDLHTRAYREILEGRGTGIPDARPAIELVYALNQSDIVSHPQCCHPMLKTARAFEMTPYRRAA